MAVYVDDAMIPYRNMKMSHMVADHTDELLDMARTIGVKVMWLQYRDTHREHFDICSSKRELAIKAGAIKVSQKELATIVSKRSHQSPGRRESDSIQERT